MTWVVSGTIDEISPGVVSVNVTLTSFNLTMEDGTVLVMEDGVTPLELEDGP